MFQTPGTPSVVVYQTPIGEDGTNLGKEPLNERDKVFQIDEGTSVPWCDVMKRPDRRIRVLKKSERTKVMKKIQEIMKNIGVKLLIGLLKQRERDIRLKMIRKREGPDGRIRLIKKIKSQSGSWE